MVNKKDCSDLLEIAVTQTTKLIRKFWREGNSHLCFILSTNILYILDFQQQNVV